MSMNLLFSHGYGEWERNRQAGKCCCSDTDSTEVLLEKQVAAGRTLIVAVPDNTGGGCVFCAE
jgi:hypothetical protein